MMAMARHFVRQPDIPQTSRMVRADPRWYPYFERCLGAVDGTARCRPRIEDPSGIRYDGIVVILWGRMWRYRDLGNRSRRLLRYTMICQLLGHRPRLDTGRIP